MTDTPPIYRDCESSQVIDEFCNDRVAAVVIAVAEVAGPLWLCRKHAIDQLTTGHMLTDRQRAELAK